jgi:hypothetical protein
VAHWAFKENEEIMTKKIAVLAIIMLFVAGVMSFAADKSFGVGKTRSITFNNDTKIGDKVLPAGEYRVLHLMEGSEHTLVFKSATNNAEKVRVKCNMVDIGKKADYTSAETKLIANERVLTAITFQGDTFRHSF